VEPFFATVNIVVSASNFLVQDLLMEFLSAA
jgi:hypothetical protein